MKMRRLSAEFAQSAAELDLSARAESAWSAEEWSAYLAPTRAFGTFDGEALMAFAAFNYVLDEAELLFVTVADQARQRGYAKGLLQEALHELYLQGIRKVFLEVSENNHAALHLYGRLGFAEMLRRPRYYRDGSTAIVMRYIFDGTAARNAEIGKFETEE